MPTGRISWPSASDVSKWRRRRRVAQRRVAGPEVDARGERLVGVGAGRVERAPAPRPDRADAQLDRDLLGCERVELHELQPGVARLETLAAARARLRVEAEDQTEPLAEDAEAPEAPERPAHRRAQLAATEHRAERVDPRSGEVRLVDEVCRARELAPPGAGGAVRLQRPVDEEERTGAACGQLLGERKHVGAVHGVRRRPRVGRSAPQSSSMAISGVAQPVESARALDERLRGGGDRAGSAGWEGVPTSRVTFMCQWTV